MQINEAQALRLRKAVDTDAVPVRMLVRSAFQLYVERIGREPAPMTADYAHTIAGGLTHVVERGEELLGVLVLEHHGDHVLIEAIAVAKRAQGLGIGSMLLAHADRVTREFGLTEVRVYTNQQMTENIIFYPRKGFREVDRRREEGYNRVYFVRTLD